MAERLSRCSSTRSRRSQRVSELNANAAHRLWSLCAQRLAAIARSGSAVPVKPSLCPLQAPGGRGGASWCRTLLACDGRVSLARTRGPLPNLKGLAAQADVVFCALQVIWESIGDVDQTDGIFVNSEFHRSAAAGGDFAGLTAEQAARNQEIGLADGGVDYSTDPGE